MALLLTGKDRAVDATAVLWAAGSVSAATVPAADGAAAAIYATTAVYAAAAVFRPGPAGRLLWATPVT
jgi:hypothetical protein